MYSLRKKDSTPVSPDHPFGGCNRLLTHYQTIGGVLLKLEELHIRYSYGSSRVSKEFRQAVCFVPVEVLESYLEDLLDLESSEESLFIKRQVYKTQLKILLLCLLSVAAFYFMSPNFGLIGKTVGYLLLSLPLIVLWSMTPYGALARRIRFGRLLSQEISRRRGDDKKTKVWSNSAEIRSPSTRFGFSASA